MSTPFGTTPDGATAELFTLENTLGLRLAVTNYGGHVTSLHVPDRQGQPSDVVLGFDTLAGYTSPVFLQENPYFGALIGRYGNRIAQGRFTLDGRAYQLPINNPPNSLHGGTLGFDKRLWQAVPGTTDEGTTLALNYVSPDGEEDYPGTLHVQVVYTVLAAANTVRLTYAAYAEQPTVLNLTNHTYFNLNLGAGRDILGHELTLEADRYTPVDGHQIPTGELASVAGTPFDFRQAHAIGARLGQVPGGYDHNLVLADAMRPRPALAATLYEPASGRTLAVHTDQPGLQLYTGNQLKGNLVGKQGIVYQQYAGLALETQHFPDSPNQPQFPSTVLRPGEQFRSVTEWRFGVR
ncbi:MAG: aldose epimerase family protein [Janthinobacterium lividum]